VLSEVEACPELALVLSEVEACPELACPELALVLSEVEACPELAEGSKGRRVEGSKGRRVEGESKDEGCPNETSTCLSYRSRHLLSNPIKSSK
jgi:hypothetical protein